MERTDRSVTSVPSPPHTLWWQVGGLALLLLFLLTSSLLQLRGPRAQKSDDYARLFVETMTQSRAVYFAEHAPDARPASAAEKAALIDAMKRLADLTPDPRAIRRLALMEYALGDRDWKASLRRLYDLPGIGPSDATESELAMWRVVLEGPVNADQVREYRARIAAMRLGWYRHLALEALDRNAGLPEAARQETRSAWESTLSLMRLAQVRFLIGALGLYLGIRFGIRLLEKRRAPRREAAGGRGQPREAPASPLTPLSRRQADALYTVFLLYLSLYALFHLILSELLPAMGRDLLARLSPFAVLLINLGLDVPGFFSRFERVAEVVDGDETQKAKGRERFRFYKDRGYPLETHKL